MEELNQVCVNHLPGGIFAVVVYVIAGVSALVNFVPAPDAISNPVGKAISRVLHFLAVDIVTAAK